MKVFRWVLFCFRFDSLSNDPFQTSFIKSNLIETDVYCYAVAESIKNKYQVWQSHEKVVYKARRVCCVALQI